MSAPLDTFETALLARLRDHLGPESVGVDYPVRPRMTGRRMVLAAAGVVAAATVMVAVVPGLGSTSAYSVQQGNTGTITVEVTRLEDAAGLEADLADVGIDADITYLPDSERCAPGRYEPVSRPLSGLSVEMGGDRLRVVLPPGAVRTGETFVMAVSGADVPPSSGLDEDGVRTSGGFSGYTDFGVVAGQVGPCRAVPGTTR